MDIKIKVLKQYTDRYTGQRRKPGDVLEVTDARFREIKRSGKYAEVVKPTPKQEPKKEEK